MSQEIYNRTVFKRFFEENDPRVIAWAENVLEKISAPGILPIFIKKDSEDFQAYWGAICHLFALVVIYSRQYNEIDTNKILFELFIKNRGLVTDEVTTLEQMQYLFDNYVNEYRKRGRMDIISKEGTILGELLRLIQYNNLDELIFALLMPRDTGWTLGYSSPTWNRTDTVLNITKGYEMTQSVEDLSKYPLINPTGVRIVNDFDNDGNPIRAMNFAGNTITGISSAVDKTKLFTISENLPYEFSFQMKVTDVTDQGIHFGVQVYDELMNPMQLIEAYTPPKYQWINPNYLKDSAERNLKAPIGQDSANIEYACAAILVRGRECTFSVEQSYAIEGSFTEYTVAMFGKTYSGNFEIISKLYRLKIDGIQTQSVIMSPEFSSIYESFYILVYAGIAGSTSGNAIRIVRAKLEMGEDASQWVPCAQDPIIKNRTLLTNGDTKLAAENYLVGRYNRSKLVVGKYYTLIACYKTGQFNTSIDVYEDSGTQPAGFNGYLRTKWESIQSFGFYYRGRNQDMDVISFYQKPNGTFGSYVNWAVLIEGNELSSNWLPISQPSDTGIPKKSNNFVKTVSGSNGNLNFPYTDTYYQCRGTISKVNRNFASEVVLNFPYGRGLKFQPGAKYISLELTQDRTVAVNSLSGVYIYDIKFKPIYLPFYQGYLGEKNVIAAYYENNSLTSNNAVKRFIETYLISYKNIFAAQEIFANKLVSVRFKIFSDRGAYIDSASIFIAGKTLITDINGEASIQLYPGDYLASIEKDKFISVIDELETIYELETEQVIFIPLQGDIYERRITFSVKDEQNRNVSGTTVTFNGKFLVTGSDGTAVFTAFPGLYPYTVEKAKYYLVSNSILVQDDMIETVALQLIPLYTITFKVMNGSEPVPFVTINFAGRVLQTDSTGTAIASEVLGGTYDYTAEKKDWLPVSGTVTVSQNQTVNISMSPVPTYDITFLVNNYDPTAGTKVPFPGITVSYAGLTKVTGSDGTAVFTVKGGYYNYSVSYTGYISQNGTYVAAADSTKIIDLAKIQYKTTVKVLGTGNQVLRDAVVQVGSQTLRTDSNGLAVFNLTNGTYAYKVNYLEYNEKTGSIVVNGAEQTITVNLVQKTYSVTFTVRQENAISSGASVTLGNEIKLTDNLGQVTFLVPIGQFSWVVSKQNYVTQTGNIDMVGNPISRDINLIRKTSTVTFYVTDDSGAIVPSATIIVAGQTGVTGANGRKDFTISVGSYEYTVSKLPDYTEQSGMVNVTENNQQVNVVLSNKVYNVIVTIKAPTGKAVSGATVTVGGNTATTNSSGQVTLRNYKNGNYPINVNATGYDYYSSNLNVSGADRYFDVNLTYVLVAGTVRVLKDGNNLPYQQITVEIYDRNGDRYSSVSPSTDSYGQATYNGPSGGTAYVDVNNVECVQLTGQQMQNGSTKTLYLWKALILTFNNSSSTPAGLGSNDYDRNGNDVRCCPGAKTNPYSLGTLSFSCSGMTRLVAIKQWPISFSIAGGTGVFKNCTGLNSIIAGSPRISGNVDEWFMGCTSLRTIPNGLFLNMTGNSAIQTFRGSGLTSTSTGPLFPISAVYFNSTFRECTSLTTLGASIFGRGGGVEDFHATFMGCTALRTTGSMYDRTESPFYRSSNALNMDYIFSDCTNLQTFGTLLLYSCTSLTNVTGMFSGCTSLTVYTTAAFTWSPIKLFIDVFRNCTYLPNPDGPAPASVTSISGVFYGCKNVTSLSQFRMSDLSNCTSIWRAFAYSGVKTIPFSYLSGLSNCISFAEAFMGCTSLTGFENNGSFQQTPATFPVTVYRSYLFLGTKFISGSTAVNCSSMFQDCSNLSLGEETFYDVKNTALYFASSASRGNVNLDRMFYNCSKLSAIPGVHVPSSSTNFVWITRTSGSGSHYQTFTGTNLGDLVPSDWK